MRVMEPPVENIHDSGSFGRSGGGVSRLSTSIVTRGGGGDLIGLICPELGVAPLVDPGTDLEDDLTLISLCLLLRLRA